MTTSEKLLAARFLKIAGDEFGDHGCSDVEPEMLDGIGGEELQRMLDGFNQWNSKGVDPIPYPLAVPDFAWMGYLAHLLEEEA